MKRTDQFMTAFLALALVLSVGCGADAPEDKAEGPASTTSSATSTSTTTTQAPTTTSAPRATTTTSPEPPSANSLAAFRVQDDSFMRHVLVVDTDAGEIMETGIVGSAEDQRSNRGTPQVTEDGLIFDPVTLQVFDRARERHRIASCRRIRTDQSGEGINRSSESFINYSGFDKAGEGTVYFEAYGDSPDMAQSLPSLVSSGLDPQPVDGKNACYSSYEWQGAGDFCTIDNQNGGAKVVSTSLDVEHPQTEALELCTKSFGFWGQDLFFDGYFGGDSELSGETFDSAGSIGCETWLPLPPTGADLIGTTWDDMPIVSNANESGTTDYYIVEAPDSEPRLIADFDHSTLG